jgi:hypothetical protein
VDAHICKETEKKKQKREEKNMWMPVLSSCAIVLVLVSNCWVAFMSHDLSQTTKF